MRNSARLRSAAGIDDLRRLAAKNRPRMGFDYIDGGFRHGADVAKALALGADAFQLGRPTLYGLAAAGEAGVRHALQILGDELARAMALAGATRISELRGRIDGAHAWTNATQ